jgi:hypothetical protein
MSEVGGEQFLQSKCSHFVLSINLENRKKKSTNLYPAMLDSHLPSSHDDYVAFCGYSGSCFTQYSLVKQKSPKSITIFILAWQRLKAHNMTVCSMSWLHDKFRLTIEQLE